jgi:hypothetical protein
VPDQRLAVSCTRTANVRKSVKLANLVASSALAVGAVVACAAAAPGLIRPPALPGLARPATGPEGSAPRQDAWLLSALAPVARDAVSAKRARDIARRMLRSFGWSRRQFKYLNWLWDRESSWNTRAENPSSGAYGIPQAVPAAKMASAGRNWRTSAKTQIRWGLAYIRATYDSPRRAWEHEAFAGWY